MGDCLIVCTWDATRMPDFKLVTSVDGDEYKFWYTEGVTAGTLLKLLKDYNRRNTKY